jgi:hypothetical protein
MPFAKPCRPDGRPRPWTRTATGLQRAFAIASLAFLAGACRSMPVRTGVSRHPWPDDLPRKEELERHGTVEVGHDVVAWFPADALSATQRATIVAQLDRGIGAAKRYIGRPDWSYRGDRHVYFYFPDARFVSHAPGGNTAFIPLWRIRDGEAPWIHEAMHLLLATPGGDWLAVPDSIADRRTPLWLSEGLAESLAMDVAAQVGLPLASPPFNVRASDLDSVCGEQLQAGRAASVLATIGARGRPAELFGPDRPMFALPFYTCSTSFVRYLSAHYGRAVLLRAFASFDAEIEVLQAAIGRPLPEVVADWRQAVTAVPPP